MNKRKNERHYLNLLEKDYLKEIISDIAKRFDFSETSWICQTIISKFNETLEKYEQENNIERLKPGEILLTYQDEIITIPLINLKNLKILADTKLFPPYKKRVIENVLTLLKKIDTQATIDDVHSLISPRETVPRYQDGGNLRDIQIDPSFPLIKPHDIGVKLNKLIPAVVSLPVNIKKTLIEYGVHQLGLKPFVAQNLLDYFLERRAYYLPLKKSVKPGQLVWLGSSIKKCYKPENLFLKQKQVPIILTLYTKQELENRPKDLAELNSQMMNQLARITTEAYLQETLLPLDELQLFYLRSSTVLGKLIRKYMNMYKVILTTPGSILDAGTMFTHKELIIDLAMQGYYTKEIAKKTYHDPRSVDAYLKTLNSVLILWYFDLPTSLISMVTEKGITVVKEHITIIEKYFPNKEIIKNYLYNRGIAV
jgi:hypothetical protein